MVFITVNNGAVEIRRQHTMPAGGIEISEELAEKLIACETRVELDGALAEAGVAV